MGFNRGRWADERNRLDDIRIKRPLGEKLDLSELPSLFFEHSDESMADAPAFLFWIFHASKHAKKFLAGIGVAKAAAEPLGKQLANSLGLVLAQKAVVDENETKSLPDAELHRGRGHG